MTTFAIIYSSKNDVRMHQMHILLKEYEDIVRISDGYWLIECDGNPIGIKYYLNKIVMQNGR